MKHKNESNKEISYN